MRAAALLAIVAIGCGALRAGDAVAPPPGPPPATAGAREAAAQTGASPSAAVCAADRLGTVRARFRADVTAGGERRAATGVLLVRRPGALRVKLFGIAGLTVHDAVVRGDAAQVRARVSGVATEAPLTLVQTPDAPIQEPAARLSLVLWALWQARCPTPPRPASGASVWVLDPAPAQLESREVEVDGGAVATEELRWADGALVRVRYGDYDRTRAVPLPRRIEIEMPQEGWTAAVAVSEYDVDEPLDDGLFALPDRERAT